MYPTTNGWTVTGNATPLAPGSLQVNTYSAVGTPTVVGANIAITYIKTQPGPNNTTVPNGNPTTNINWIQVVADNNAITYPGGVPTSNPGTPENTVDVIPANTTTPYYPGYAGNSTGFVDTPRRPDVEFDNSWTAALFLVSGPAAPGTAANPATITVYNDSGITWGWDNFFFTNVNEQQFIADVEQDVFGQQQLGPDADYAFYEQAFLASVPESSSWTMMLIGFLGLGIAGHRRARKTPVIS